MLFTCSAELTGAFVCARLGFLLLVASRPSLPYLRSISLFQEADYSQQHCSQFYLHIRVTETQESAANLSVWHAGVDSFDVVWQENKVVASGDFDVEALVAKLNKSGKQTSMA